MKKKPKSKWEKLSKEQIEHINQFQPFETNFRHALYISNLFQNFQLKQNETNRISDGSHYAHYQRLQKI